MTRSVRALILLVGVLSTYVYATGVPAPDGNPWPTCSTKARCQGSGVVVNLQR